ncbi:MAG: hypothetical protein HY934_04445 [Candidatus Firestonebacteria bacterium]|nr:hypothetical protein [Candidatus Firestonebacteria bacterium]
MDVMTAKMRALKFKQKKTKNGNRIVSVFLPNVKPAALSQLEKIETVDVKNAPAPKKDLVPGVDQYIVPSVEDISALGKKEIRQKNIQLRIDQIKSLREFTFKSGDLKGSQLNESQICRAALDLLFWLDINPMQVETEEELLDLIKRSVKKI